MLTVNDEEVSSATPGNENTEGKESIEEILIPLGGFGRFQIQQMFYISVMAILCAISELSYTVTTAEVPHRCLVPGCETLDNAIYNSTRPWLDASIPLTAEGTFEWCIRKNNTDDFCHINPSLNNINVTCATFVYETEEWTIAREDWDIHCSGDKWMLTLLGSLNNGGQVFGGLFLGFLSDSFGRKVVLVTLSVVATILGTIKSFSVNYVMMAVIEFFEASLAAGLYNNCFVLALEIVDPTKRVLAGTIVACAYPLGEILLGGVQMATLQWRTTLRILYPPFILTILFIWTIPESVRFLTANHRNKAAAKVLKQIASTNKRPISDELIGKVLSGELVKDNPQGGLANTKAAIMASLRSQRIRLRFLINIAAWIGITFVYFGMTINSVSFSDNKFVNLMLIGFIEIPASVLTMFVLDRIGRRICLSSSLIMCGVCNVISAYIPDDADLDWLKLVLYLGGKFAVTASFMVGDIFTTEMFPTSVRAAVMQISLLSGKIVTIAAPQISLLGDIYKPLPLLIFTIFALISGVMALLLPETLHQHLPDTVEEAEQLGRKNSKANVR